MMQMLALLECGTRGTQAEPAYVLFKVLGKRAPDQRLAPFGTRGTCEIEHAKSRDRHAQRVAGLAGSSA